MPFDPFDHPIGLDLPRRITKAAAWVEHIPFGMTLIDMLRPSLVVELGTFWGDSYCAFCQAVDRSKLTGTTRCIAVDTWQGDSHTGEYAGILDDLRSHHDPLYGSFSTLKQTTFDQAARDVADGSVDLLHIDGLHTYEAVKHDFETWLPKVSDRGVVLFHDTAERGGDFGVWKLWEELSPRYPASMQFTYSHGLGVLGVGKAIPAKMMEYFVEARQNPRRISMIYLALGQRAQLYKTSQSLLRNMQATFKILNQQRQASGLPVDPNTESLDVLQGYPVDFAEFLKSEVERLCGRETK
jgi:O-antigen biosynthesis protein